jgi:hypothetical protein
MAETDEVDPEVAAAAAELAELRALRTKYKPLEGIAEELESDPSKIYRLRAALEGRYGDDNAYNNRPQQNNQPPPLTPEQLAELNRQFYENPAGFAAQIAQEAARRQMNDFANQAGPVVETTADLFIETFKNGKAGEDSLYKQILPEFNKQIHDINRRSFLAKSAAERQRDLDLRWQSAAAAVFRKAASVKEREEAVNIGKGGGSSAPAKKATVFSKDPLVGGLAAQLGLTEEEMADIQSSIDEENE